MIKPKLLPCLFSAVLLLACGSTQNRNISDELPASNGIISLNELLVEHITSTDVPAIAAAVFKGGKIIAKGVVGSRRSGTTEQVTIQDKFHIGSCGKSFTATLIGVLVEEGHLSWTTTLTDVFPDLRGKIHKDYEAVNLVHLLSHTSGLPNVTNINNWTHNNQDFGDRLIQIRRKKLTEILQLRSVGLPGKTQLYSNRGVSIAAMMAEKVTGEAWESLVRQKLFEPLGLNSAGFGWPATPANADQPWGHSYGRNGLVSHAPDTAYGPPPEIAPAGDIHMSVDDFARWTGFHLMALNGKANMVLSGETMRFLHTRVYKNTALGWGIKKQEHGMEVHSHWGSGGTFVAVMNIIPEADLAIVVLTNQGASSQVVRGVLRDLTKMYSSE